MTSYEVEEDLKENHGRSISRNRIQAISDRVGALIEEKQSVWTYRLPEHNATSRNHVVMFSNNLLN